MEILGVGASELVFVVIIALILLGPKDMQKAGRTIGKWMRDIVTSEGWKVFQKTSSELRNLPARMMREANTELDKIKIDVKKDLELEKSPESRPHSVDEDTASKTKSNSIPYKDPENTILPPPMQIPPDNSADEE